MFFLNCVDFFSKATMIDQNNEALGRKSLAIHIIWHKPHRRNSQNFLCKFIRFFVTLGLKIFRPLSLKVVFDADMMITAVKIVNDQFFMNVFVVKASESYEKS